MAKRFLLLLMVFVLAGCVTPAPKLDPLSFKLDKGERETVPRACKSRYEHPETRVAVVNFTNNTTFDFAHSVQTGVQGQSQRQTAGGAAVGAVPGAAGVVWGSKTKRQFQTDSQRIERQINAKIPESVEDGVTNEIVNMGGCKVITRREMDKILGEQKFQQSGLVDDSQLVRLGKIAGIRYVVTGSVNNVNLAWRNYGSRGFQQQQGFGYALAGGLLSAQEGWNIQTDIALRILDVETGEILFSKVVSGTDIVGKVPYPSYDALIGGIKKAASRALVQSRPELSKWFTVKGYIQQTRTSDDGKDRSARISVGEKSGLKPGSKLVVYTFEEFEDENPQTGQRTVTCSVLKLPVELIVSDQIQPDNAWVVIQGDQKAIKRVRAGQLVERMPAR